MKNREHLPVFGVGPLYGAFVIGSSVLCGYWLARGAFLPLRIVSGPLKIIWIAGGILMTVSGILVWSRAALGKGCIDQYILRNELRTEGVYRFVRNPCYSGIMYACTGLLSFFCNGIVVFLFLADWLLMTVLMKATEERWLERQYGKAYLDYCSRVNRCIPWIRNRKS